MENLQENTTQLQSELSPLPPRFSLEKIQSYFQNKILKIILIVIVGIVLVFSIFWLGVQTYFPGKAISNYAKLQLEKRNLFLELTPAELSWGTLSTSLIHVLAPPNMNLEIERILTLEQVELSLLPLIQEQLHVALEAYGGNGKVDFDLEKMNELHIQLNNITLDQIPVLHIIPFAFLRGDITQLDVQVNNIPTLMQTPQSMPEGILKGRLQQVRIQLKTEDYPMLAGFEFPEMYFSSVQFEFLLGQKIQIQKLYLIGDITGELEGTLEVAVPDPTRSRMNLIIKGQLDEEFESELGIFAPYIQPLKCNDGTFHLGLEGTLTQINLPQKRGC